MSSAGLHHGRIRNGTERRRARVHPRGTAVGLYPVQAEYRNAAAGSPVSSGIEKIRRRCGCPGSDRPGGRPGPAPRPAALAGLSARGPVRRALRRRSLARPVGGAAERPTDRRRPRRSRNQRGLPAAGGCAGRRRRRRHRQPRLWNRAGKGRRDCPRRDRGAGAGWHFTGAQAHSRAWAGDRGQPFPASGGRYLQKRAGTD